MLKLSHPITSINGFKIGDKVRLIDGDGRPHVIKSFSIDGIRELFFEVQFEDETETMLNNIAPLTSDVDIAAEEYAENILAGGEDMFDAIADGFRAGAEWQKVQDIRLWDSRTASYNPNMKISEEEKKAAVSFAYDFDAYMEGAGPNISDVIQGFYGGLTWQKEQDKETIELAEDHALLAGRVQMKEEMMKEAVEAYVNTYKKIGVGGYVEFVADLPVSRFKEYNKVKLIILPSHEKSD